ncbi:MAG: sensor histidine kinase [Caldilineaceae bacterium]|nr:sensor histidine kinase [Caldilineaceae bacterium]
MDQRVQAIPGLSPADREVLQRVEAGLSLTADVSRADVMLCTVHGASQALVALHAMPNSISSLYRNDATGRLLSFDEHPLIFQALRNGSGGRRQREVLSNGAPIIQDVFPIRNGAGPVIGAMVVETNMIAHERQQRRNRHFRQAVVALQEMCTRGELSSALDVGPFTIYDGIYLVNMDRTLLYMSGISANLFRSIGVIPEMRNQRLAALEEDDIDLVERAFESGLCEELRQEYADGRIWVRIAIPLYLPTLRWRNAWFSAPWEWPRGGHGGSKAVNQVMVLMHNATEAVQKQRELNVKSAMIQEVHHRVKNNLQNIAAILRIQARRVESDEARQHLNEAVNRVLSMSVIHEFLSQDEHRSINIKDVCKRIAGQVQQVSGNVDQTVTCTVTGPNIRLPASQATPVAMVINELMLNAVEHGLRDRTQGEISIVLDDLGDAVRVIVEDNGGGLPPGFDPAQQTSSLGLHIVHTLVTDELKGALIMHSVWPENAADGSIAAPVGAQAVVSFPKRSLPAE